jgi:hypothetical protein
LTHDFYPRRSPVRNERLWPRVALGLVALAALVGVGVVDPATRGADAPAPPGTIYFSGWVATSGNKGYYAGMSMRGDGTGKTLVRPNLERTPSFRTHGGSRWRLDGDYDWNGPLDADGVPPYELFAVDEQNHWVQLTHGPADNAFWVGWDLTAVAWGKDDSFVSFAGWSFTADGGVAGGLYAATLDWSTGTPVAGPPQFLVPAETVWYGGWAGDVNLYEQDWSPDGTAVAFRQGNPTNAFLSVADLIDGAAVHPLAAGTGPAWSPDGGRIAFGSGGEIWTIKPDGTGAIRLLAKATVKNVTYTQGGPSWSPDGAYLAYTEAAASSSKTTRAVKRIPAGGGTAVSLTSDLANASGPEWRP